MAPGSDIRRRRRCKALELLESFVALVVVADELTACANETREVGSQAGRAQHC